MVALAKAAIKHERKREVNRNVKNELYIYIYIWRPSSVKEYHLTQEIFN